MFDLIGNDLDENLPNIDFTTLSNYREFYQQAQFNMNKSMKTKC